MNTQKNTLVSSSLEGGELNYQQGLLWMQKGLFREAINYFAKASFFMPHKPQPFIASAECYVSLCDFQGAVKQYRRSLWLLRSREDEEEKKKREEELLLLNHHTNNTTSGNATGIFHNGRHSIESISNPLSRSPSIKSMTPPPSALQVRHSINTNNSTNISSSDRAIAEAVQGRLAGILDALSIVLFNAKDYTQALRFADDSLELSEHPQVILHRCAYLVALEREDEAEKCLEKHIKQYPSFFIESSSLLIYLYCLRQAFRHAKALLDKVPLQDRQHPQIILSQFIFDSTYREFRERSITNSDLQGLTRCLVVFPEDATLLFERAKYYISKGMDKKAVPELFRCIKVSDGRHKASIELMTKTLFRLGASLDGQNGIKDAIDYYTTSLLWQPENIHVLLARGDCYTKVEDYQHALQDFMRVESISPKNPDAIRRIAFLHDIWGSKFHALGKIVEAEKEFSNAISRCDTEAIFYYHRARCRFDLNEPRYALRDVLSCQKLNPEDPVIRDFITAHLGTLTNISDDIMQDKQYQKQNKVILPKVSSRVPRRVMELNNSINEYSKNADDSSGSFADNNNNSNNIKAKGYEIQSEIKNEIKSTGLSGLLTCRKAKLMPAVSQGNINILPSSRSSTRRTPQSRISGKSIIY